MRLPSALRGVPTRDQSHYFLSNARLNLNAVMQKASYLIVVIAVIGSLIYDQRKDPSKVKLPKFDGRSGVT